MYCSGAASALSWILIGFLLGSPETWQILAYPLFGAGWRMPRAGLRGWSVRVGEEALYDTSRAVSAAQSPREIVAAIGENLAGSEVNGVSLWEQTGEGGDANEFSLMGSWSPRTGRQLPPGTRLSSSQMPPLAELGRSGLPGATDRGTAGLRGRSLERKKA